MARSPVSMADVARHAGVSPQTVSRVSTGAPGVRESTKRRVLASMDALRYRPNSAARALKRGSFRSIAIVLSNLSSTGSSRLIEGVVRSANRTGYTVTVLTVGQADATAFQGAAHRLREAAVDGVIFVGEQETVLRLRDFADDALVVVAAHPGDEYPVVDANQSAGTRAAVEHLLGLGHRTVHHVAGPGNSFAAQRRLESWRQCLEDHGCPVPEPIIGDWSADSGFTAGHALAEDPEVTAVFAANDEMALGLMRAFTQRGLTVPGDVSVVGFDDVPSAGNYPTPLTTVRQDFDGMARRCVELVLAQVAGAERSSDVYLIPTTLVVRESTAPPSR